MLIVQKFGGSSLADEDKMRRAAGICAFAVKNGHKVAAVVSAMGDSTDLLLSQAQTVSPNASTRESAALVSTGEQQSASLMAMTLEAMGIPAVSLTGWQCGIFTDSVFDDASPEVTFPTRVEEALEKNILPVVAGYQGVDIAGNITTLGRGGSDTSAVLLAAALKADRCEIYTDVDGIYTADPRLVKTAKRLDTIDFRDMFRLAEAGSQVLHDKSVRLAAANNVEITLLSADSSAGYSTVRRLSDEERPDFAGVTADRSKRRLTLVGKKAGPELLPRIVLELYDMGIRAEGGGAENGLVYITVEEKQLMTGLKSLHDMFF